MRSPLFEQANREQETGQRWTVQSSKMLRVALGPEVLAAQGAMVAYQGNIDFSYQGSRSLGGMIKKAATGEGGNLMRVAGQGEVFFARSAQNVFLLQLEGDAITVNTPSLLAFDAHLGYDIRMLGNAGGPCRRAVQPRRSGAGRSCRVLRRSADASGLLPAADLR